MCIFGEHIYLFLIKIFFSRQYILVMVFPPSSPPGSSPPIQLHSFFLPTHPSPCFLSLYISRRGKNQLLCPEIQGTSLFHLLKDQRRHFVSRGLRRILTEGGHGAEKARWHIMFQATERLLALPLPLTVVTAKGTLGNQVVTPSRRQPSLLFFFQTPHGNSIYFLYVVVINLFLNKLYYITE